jgi:hypothetical protein
LHIEAYHSLFNKRKEENKQHIKIPRRNLQKKNWKEKFRRKISYFIKGSKMITLNTSSTQHTHAKTSEKLQEQITQKLNGKRTK